MRRCGAHQPEWRSEVDGHHRVPDLVGRRVERAGRDRSRGIDQHIDAAERIDRGGHDLLRRIAGRHVGRTRDRPATRGPNDAGHLAQSGLVAPNQHDRRRFAPERRRGGSTDPARGPGYDDCLVTKQHAGEFYTPCIAEGTLCHDRSTTQPGRGASGFGTFPPKRPKLLGKRFASRRPGPERMPLLSSGDAYSAREIALAAGVSEAQVKALMGAGSRYVGHDEAVRIGRVALLQARQSSERPVSRAGLFAIFSEAPPTIGSRRVFALSSTVHATVLASCLFMAAFNLAPRAASLKLDEPPADPMRMVFLMTPGPGGGGGGGGLVQQAPPPKAL